MCGAACIGMMPPPHICQRISYSFLNAWTGLPDAARIDSKLTVTNAISKAAAPA